MSKDGHRNRLASESSAYLQQHAGNPVDWYPWGDEALSRARREEKPILLSVGYSACHWCHVMERECFENADIAALMNEHFVCIKVDREERPDVDHLYMKALQGMTGRGGWPMTIFLTPDARPFFGGTYFPPEDRGGMAGFPRVLTSVARTWHEKRDDVVDSAGRMVEFLARDRTSGAAPGSLDDDALTSATDALVGAMDEQYGGFGIAPKFPGSMSLQLLMQTAGSATARRRSKAGGERQVSLVRLSLDGMADGGIRDHLGGGFHRYSVDRFWLVPHFEKMLYDQALLAPLYLDAASFFADEDYAGIAEEILDYVLREMTSPAGGFYSAQDADSEGEEGLFFVWTKDEIVEVLGEESGEEFSEVYGVREEGNFEGRNILHRALTRADFRERYAARSEEIERELSADREALLQRRLLRIPPATDRKVVADWNALMISAMARGGRALERSDFVDAAERAAAFVRDAMGGSGALRHMHADGSARVPAFLDDYAFFGRACLDLFEIRPKREHIVTARHCADVLLADFADRERGGFFFTAASGEELITRTSDLYDGAQPSGNSVAAELLLRLWALTGEDAYREAGERVLARFLGDALRYPSGASLLLALADRYRRGLRTVVVVGEDAVRARLSRSAREVYDPACSVFEIAGEEEWLPAALRGKAAPERGAAAYVCEGSTCSLPISDEALLRERLREG